MTRRDRVLLALLERLWLPVALILWCRMTPEAQRELQGRAQCRWVRAVGYGRVCR